MYDNLTGSDKQALQSSINQTVHKLKGIRSKLGQDFFAGHLPKEKYESGRRAITDRITQLHNIKYKMGINTGFSQQPGSQFLLDIR